MKRVAIAVFLLAVMFFNGVSYSAYAESVSGTAQAAQKEGKFFEPTNEQSSTHWQEIQAQWALYKAAKDKKEWAVALEHSLWHFTDGWLYFSWAMEEMSLGHHKKAEELFASADRAQVDAVKAGHHKRMTKLLRTRIDKNRALNAGYIKDESKP